MGVSADSDTSMSVIEIERIVTINLNGSTTVLTSFKVPIKVFPCSLTASSTNLDLTSHVNESVLGPIIDPYTYEHS